jgi:preprotein translocase subunit SecA
MLGRKIKIDDLDMDASGAIEFIYEKLVSGYEEKIKEVPETIVDEFEKAITLRVIDTYWMEHINTMSHLREGIHLRGYAQENPLRAYKSEGYELFDSLLSNIDTQSSTYLIKAEIRHNVERKKVAEGVANTDSSKEKKPQPKRVAKVGRNDKCPCGSGKKYKNCCGK